MRANTTQGLKPQPAKFADLGAIQRRGCPCPVGPQVRAGVGVDGAGVELHGVHQRHGQSRAGGGKRQAFLADPPQIIGDLSRRSTQTPQIVKPDRGVEPGGQVDVAVQVTQHTVGQGVREGAKLLFGVLDHRPQRRLAGDYLGPGQLTDR
jgi:hypothetical protein